MAKPVLIASPPPSPPLPPFASPFHGMATAAWRTRLPPSPHLKVGKVELRGTPSPFPIGYATLRDGEDIRHTRGTPVERVHLFHLDLSNLGVDKRRT